MKVLLTIISCAFLFVSCSVKEEINRYQNYKSIHDANKAFNELDRETR